MTEKNPKKTVIAAMSDIHVGEASAGEYKNIFSEISSKADALVLCGDLTQRGTLSEAEVLVGELSACKVPVIAVMGNHDFESGQQDQIESLLQGNKVNVLDGEYFMVNDVGIAGAKGFCGGFSNYALAAWGEKIIKDFVYESLTEALKLESALNYLETEKKIAVTHYSPIWETVSNEPKEIYPFLGSSRLLEPLHRFGVKYAFHGHAHEGPHEFKTDRGLTVMNVSYPLMKKHSPDRPYALVSL